MKKGHFMMAAMMMVFFIMAAKVLFFLRTCKLGGYDLWGVAIVKIFIGF